MVYLSKRKTIRDFFKNRNGKFYIAIFLLLFVAIAAVIVIATTKHNSNNNPVEAETSSSGETENATEEEVPVPVGKYLFRINLSSNILTIFSYNADTAQFDTAPTKVMLCGISSELYEKGPQYIDQPEEALQSRLSWSAYENNFYRYYTNWNGTVSFHSALYETMSDKNSLIVEDYNTIGEQTNHAGITLLLADAKWIYENCSFDSEIEFYADDTEQYPATEFSKITIPEDLRWDPSEISGDSPWCPYEIASFSCDKEINVRDGISTENLLKHANAYGRNGENLSEYIYFTVNGYYNFTEPGQYVITYHISDIYGNTFMDSTVLTIAASSIEKETETQKQTEQESESRTEAGSSAVTETSAETEKETESVQPETNEAASSEEETKPSSEISETEPGAEEEPEEMFAP